MWFDKALDNFVTLNTKIKFSCFHLQLFHTISRKNTERTVFGILLTVTTSNTHRFTPQHKLPYIFVLSFGEIKQFPEDNPSNEMSFLTVLSPLGPFHSSL